MPWREVSAMDERREFVRLAMQEGVNRRELCRRFGISPEVGYKWLARWQAGDRELADRSRRPHVSPGRSEAEIEARVLAVRDKHPAWGARKIAHFLKRDGLAVPVPSTVIRSCVGTVGSNRAGTRRRIRGTVSRRKLQICCGRWTSRATCRWSMGCSAIH
jgi:transposase-like protein